MAELGTSDHESGFYAVLPTPPALVGGLTLLTEALVLARRLPVGVVAALEIESLISSVEEKVTAAGQQTAAVADKSIIDKINQTRVRPEADRGRKQLADGVKSESLGLGQVGVGSIEALNTVVGSDGKPFWRAQEYGSSHLVGRTIYGAFQPGDALPSREDFRLHPIFQAGAGGAMHIRRPIPARYFLRDGTAEASVYRDRVFRETETIAVGAIRSIRATVRL